MRQPVLSSAPRSVHNWPFQGQTGLRDDLQNILLLKRYDRLGYLGYGVGGTLAGGAKTYPVFRLVPALLRIQQKERGKTSTPGAKQGRDLPNVVLRFRAS